MCLPLLMHPTGETRPARRMLFLIAVMLAVSLLPASSTADDFPTGPGLDWTLPESHGLYITGADGSESWKGRCRVKLVNPMVTWNLVMHHSGRTYCL